MGKTKTFLLFILLFAISFILSFILFFLIAFKLYDFKVINAIACLVGSSVASFVISLLIVLFLYMDIAKNTMTKIKFWIEQQISKFILAYILLCLFTISIRKENLWTASEIKETLNVIWTIFGISITIFLVWNVLIVDYLKKKQPQKLEKSNLLKNYKVLLDKKSFLVDAQTIFNSIVLLTINLFFILFVTSLIYISNLSENLLTQNLTIFVFYLSTNTLVSLFLDILKPLYKEKKNIFNENKISFEEIKKSDEAIKKIYKLSSNLKEKFESNELSEEQKGIEIKEYSRQISGILDLDCFEEQKKTNKN